MNILITAVSGQLGNAIAKRAIERFGAEHVFGTARNPDKVDHKEIKIFKADYNSKSDFEKALKNIDVLLLISGMDAPDKRIEQHQNIINAAKECGVRKIVYTSIIGKPGNSMFDAIINANRQTEKDITESGLQYAIGRNGLYIEPDIEFIENYIKDGKIANSAGNGKCSYTSRDELAQAYVKLIEDDSLIGNIYNLVGNAITQEDLVQLFNKYFNSNLIFEPMPVEAYLEWQKNQNGEFLGAIISGIYQKIRNNEFNVVSDFEKVLNRKHKDIAQIIKEYSDKIK